MGFFDFLDGNNHVLYIESKGLTAVTVDSVKSFSGKVKSFVKTYPFAKLHDKYPLIIDNIKMASLCLNITIDTTWAGDTIIYF